MLVFEINLFEKIHIFHNVFFRKLEKINWNFFTQSIFCIIFLSRVFLTHACFFLPSATFIAYKIYLTLYYFNTGKTVSWRHLPTFIRSFETWFQSTTSLIFAIIFLNSRNFKTSCTHNTLLSLKMLLYMHTDAIISLIIQNTYNTVM